MSVLSVKLPYFGSDDETGFCLSRNARHSGDLDRLPNMAASLRRLARRVYLKNRMHKPELRLRNSIVYYNQEHLDSNDAGLSKICVFLPEEKEFLQNPISGDKFFRSKFGTLEVSAI